MLFIYPVEKSEVTKILCPKCKERLQRVGLLPGSKVDGLTFVCRCGKTWGVKTE
jgi:hypothetical protein